MQTHNFAQSGTKRDESHWLFNLPAAVFRQFSAWASGARGACRALIALAAVAGLQAAAPVIVPPPSTTVIEDTGRTNLTFLVTDDDTPFFAVTVTARSANTNLVPNANLAIVGSGTSRTVGITPQADRSGTNLIHLIASDGTTTVTNSFVFNVTGVNDSPVMGPLTNLTVLEDAKPTNRTILVTDVDTPIGIVTLTASSSDTNLVQTQVSGSTTNRTLRLTIVSNAVGTATIRLIARDPGLSVTNSFDVTVTPVNDAPRITTLTPLTILEDGVTNRTVVLTDPDTDIGSVTTTADSSNTNVATATILLNGGTNRTLTLSPAADAVGTTTIRVIADDGDKRATNSFLLTVAPVNDKPSFTIVTNLITLAEDSGVYSLANFASNISTGPTNESTQTKTFLITSTSNAFFTVLPSITPTGSLSFRTATNVFGTNTLTIVMRDSGGTNSGGIAASDPVTLKVVVTPVNDAPFIATNAPFVIREDAGATNRAISIRDVDTAINIVTITATNSNSSIATVAVTGSGTNRTLTVTTVTNMNGTGTITLLANDGQATWTNSFPLTITAINDRPTFDLATNVVVAEEDSGDFSLPNFATNILSGPADEAGQTNVFVMTVTNNAFFATLPAISTNGTLTFRPAANRSGTNNVRVFLRDNFGTTNGGLNISLTQQFAIVVTGTNDAPVIAGLSDFTINEDRGRTNRNFTVTDADHPITNVVVTAFSSDPDLVTVSLGGAANSTNKTLSITTVTNAAGTSTISVVATDGMAATTNSFVLTVAGVNDGPVLGALTNIAVLEDAAPIVRGVVVSDIDNDLSELVVEAVSSATNVAAVSVTGTNLTVTPAADAAGTATIQFSVSDGARTVSNSFTVTITPVNDAPEFTLSTNNVVVAEDSAAQTLPNFLTGIAAGPASESAETNYFVVTSADTAFFAAQPAISPAGTLAYQLATNASGTNVVSIVMWDSGGTNNGGINQSAAQTFNIVATPVNDAPVLAGLADFSVDEDGSTNVSFTVSDVDSDLATVTIGVSSSDTNLVSATASGTTTNRTLAVTTGAGQFGSATLTLITTDTVASVTNTVVVTVEDLNDAPSFTLTTNIISVAEDSGAFSLPNFATNILAGPTNESSQTLQFVVTVTNTAFFATQPEIAANGTLSFEPAANAFGTNTISVQLQDDGGTNNGGVDISAAQDFQLVIVGTNDAPVLSGLSALAIDEDSGETNIVITVEDTDTEIASVDVTVTSLNTAIATVAIAGTDAERTVTITTVTNGAGAVTLRFVADDGAALVTNNMTLTVNGINDLPVMAPLTNIVMLEDAAPVIRTVVIDDPDHTNVVVTPTTSDAAILGAAISGSGASQTLTLTPATNAFGTVTVTLVANDGSGTTTNEFDVEITTVNDAPSFTLSTNLLTIAEDSGAQTVAAFLEDISSGPANESGETNHFVVTSSDTSFFAVQPSIAPDGALTYTVATNAHGTNSLSIVMHDSGGTADGGTNVTAGQTIDIVVTPVNDMPSIVGLEDYSVREDSGANNKAFTLMDVDDDIGDVTITVSSSVTNIATATLSGSGTNRTLVVTPVADMVGDTTVTLLADDGSLTNTLAITVAVTSVNDQPSFTLSTNAIVVLEDSGSFSLANVATNIVVGPANEASQTNFFILIFTDTSMYETLPAISPEGILTFEPKANAFGTNTIRVFMRDSGGATNTGVNTSAEGTLTIAITGTNDAPTISGLSAMTVAEDSGATNVVFSVEDVDSDVASVIITPSSADTNVATVEVTGTAAERTLSITTSTNGAGPVTIVLVASDGISSSTNSYTLTVTPSSDAPILGVLTNLVLTEDSGATNLTVSVDDPDTASGSVTLAAVSSDTDVVAVAITGSGTNRTMTITPVTNMFGSATITYHAGDGSLFTTNSFSVTVTSVNDAPSFAFSTNTVVVAEDSGLVTLANFATDILSGPANEAAQTNLFVVTAADTSYFTNQPAISPAGTLTFRAKTNVFGTNTITVVLRDSGGTTNGGVNESVAQTFDIVVSDVNDLPVMSTIASFTIREDAAATNRTFTVRDTDTDITNVTVTATSSDPDLVSLAVTGTTTNRTLTITTLTNANGSATITVVADDTRDTVTNTFTLTVTPVNDAPSFTLTSTNVTVTEYSTLVSIPNFATDVAAGPTNESAQALTFLVTAGNTNSFVVQPAIAANGTLTFQAKDVAGVASVSVRLQDNGGALLGGTNLTAVQTFIVNVPANPFVPLAGQFSGLFYETNGVLNSSAGYLSFTLATNGAYNGYVLLAGGSNSFSGQFVIAGTATNTIVRTNGGDLDLAMTLDMSTNFTESATGTLTHSNWTAELLVDRATFGQAGNPAPVAGEYNVFFPGASDADLPEGHGFGLVSVDEDGTVTLSGELADGTEIAQVTSLSRDNVWPLYVSLYDGEGLVLGWVTFAFGSTNDLSGNTTWIKESGSAGLYGDGFTNDFSASGSIYFEPEIGTRVLDLTTGTITFDGGDLSTPVTAAFTLNTDQTVTVDVLDMHEVSVSIDVQNGTFSGSFIHPDLGFEVDFGGVILQSGGNALGYFVTPFSSGSVTIAE